MYTDDKTTISYESIAEVRENLVLDLLNPVSFDKQMLFQPGVPTRASVLEVIKKKTRKRMSKKNLALAVYDEMRSDCALWIDSSGGLRFSNNYDGESLMRKFEAVSVIPKCFRFGFPGVLIGGTVSRRGSELCFELCEYVDVDYGSFLEYLLKKSKHHLVHELVEDGRKVSFGNRSVLFKGENVVSSYVSSVEATMDFFQRVWKRVRAQREPSGVSMLVKITRHQVGKVLDCLNHRVKLSAGRLLLYVDLPFYTLSDIAREHCIGVSQLLRLNPQLNAVDVLGMSTQVVLGPPETIKAAIARWKEDVDMLKLLYHQREGFVEINKKLQSTSHPIHAGTMVFFTKTIDLPTVTACESQTRVVADRTNREVEYSNGHTPSKFAEQEIVYDVTTQSHSVVARCSSDEAVVFPLEQPPCVPSHDDVLKNRADLLDLWKLGNRNFYIEKHFLHTVPVERLRRLDESYAVRTKRVTYLGKCYESLAHQLPEGRATATKAVTAHSRLGDECPRALRRKDRATMVPVIFNRYYEPIRTSISPPTIPETPSPPEIQRLPMPESPVSRVQRRGPIGLLCKMVDGAMFFVEPTAKPILISLNALLKSILNAESTLLDSIDGLKLIDERMTACGDQHILKAIRMKLIDLIHSGEAHSEAASEVASEAHSEAASVVALATAHLSARAARGFFDGIIGHLLELIPVDRHENIYDLFEHLEEVPFEQRLSFAVSLKTQTVLQCLDTHAENLRVAHHGAVVEMLRAGVWHASCFAVYEKCKQLAYHCEHWYPMMGLSIFNIARPIEDDSVITHIDAMLRTEKIMNVVGKMDEFSDSLDKIIEIAKMLYCEEESIPWITPLLHMREDTCKPLPWTEARQMTDVELEEHEEMTKLFDEQKHVGGPMSICRKPLGSFVSDTYQNHRRPYGAVALSKAPWESVFAAELGKVKPGILRCDRFFRDDKHKMYFITTEPTSLVEISEELGINLCWLQWRNPYMELTEILEVRSRIRLPHPPKSLRVSIVDTRESIFRMTGAKALLRNGRGRPKLTVGSTIKLQY